MTGVNRFNKKKFNEHMLNLFNDPNFKFEISKFSHDGVKLVEIMPSKEFRSWCRKLLIQTGMDKDEAGKVLKEDFKMDTANGLYDFFVAAMYTYMEEGNKFDLLSKNDFKGSVYLSKVPKTKKKSKYYSPKDRSYVGEFETETEPFVKLKASSECPKYLKKRKKV